MSKKRAKSVKKDGTSPYWYSDCFQSHNNSTTKKNYAKSKPKKNIIKFRGFEVHLELEHLDCAPKLVMELTQFP